MRNENQSAKVGGSAERPSSPAATAPAVARTGSAPAASTTHAAASATMPARIDTGDSSASAARSERGRARNVIPKAFANAAAARPAVRASIPRAKTISTATIGEATPMPGRSDWKSSHSLKNPFSGGRPEIATAPSRKHGPVQGRRRMSPPCRFMLRVPVAWSTEPAPRNSNPLNAAWFSA